jgi:hypothetical protein
VNQPDPDCYGEQEFEDSLEPRHLIRRTDVVARAGVLMLGAGTSSLRVRQLMKRAARAVGLGNVEADISFTSLTMTVERRGLFRTKVLEVRSPGVNAHRIEMLQALSNNMPERLTATELDRRLDRIESAGQLYPAWLRGLLVALACASVTVLTGGGWREIAGVLPASALAYLMFRRLGRWQLNHLAVVLASAFTASAGYLLATGVLDRVIGEPSPRMAAGFICASIFLVPGFPLVTAGLDLTRLDLAAGIPRAIYAVMILLAITIGIWIVTKLGGILADPLPPLAAEPWQLWLIRLAASFVAVMGWAMMLNSPPATAAVSGAVALAGNSVRLGMIDAGVVEHVATFTGCVIIGLGCAVLGRAFKLEKIIMTVPTLLVSIPGSAVLRALLYFDAQLIERAVEQGLAALLGVIAMVAGLSAARMVTDPEWIFTRDDPPNLREVVPRLRTRRRDLTTDL